MATDPHWDSIRRVVARFASDYPEDTVVIGGVAVYLHTVAAGGLPVEATHDADLYVGLASFADIRDAYEVVANRRLSRHQIVTEGVEIDVYVEHNNNLRVAYADAVAGGVVIDGIRVVSCEHLLLLKLTAWADRSGSAHGDKDQRDVAKLLVLLSDVEPHFMLAQGTDADAVLLRRVLASAVFLDLTNGNAHQAAQLKKRAAAFVERWEARR